MVQCELARCPRHDPRRHDLVARERDLLFEHEAAWLRDLPRGLARFVLRRGFVEQALVPAGRATAFLNVLEQIDAPLLSELELRRFGGLYHLAGLAPAARLSALRLVNPTAAAMSALGEAALPALRELAVHTVFEDDEPPLVNHKYVAKALAALGGDRLRRLSLGGGAFEEPGLRQVAAADLPGLSSLALGDEDFTPRDLAALAAAPAWAGLVELELARCRLGDDGAEAVARAAPPRLERLVLDGNGIGPRGAAALSTLRGLRELRISGNPLGDAGLAALAAGLPDLRILAAAEVQVGAAGVASLPPSLVELDLSDNPLGERGGRALPSFPSLAALRLANTHLGDAFVPLAAERLPALRVLDVTSCGLDAPALAALAGKRILELRAARNDLGDDAAALVVSLGAQVVDLCNTGLGEPGLRRLLADPRLRALDIRQNGLPAALVAEAARRFPL